MARRDGGERRPVKRVEAPPSRCASRAGAKPVPAGAGAPAHPSGRDPDGRAGRQEPARRREPRSGEQALEVLRNAAALQHLPACARRAVDAPRRPARHAGALRGRLRGDVPHEGAARASRGAREGAPRASGSGAAPRQTRRVELFDGREGFDFLGCHLRKRMSGTIRERDRKRLCFRHRWPSQRSMKRIRQSVKELTPRRRCNEVLRVVIAGLNAGRASPSGTSGSTVCEARSAIRGHG